MSSKVLGVATGETYTTAVHDLGTRFLDRNGTLWVFAKAESNAKTAGKVYILDHTYTLKDAITHALVTTTINSVFKLGVPQNAFAANAYGWVAVQGAMTVNILASCKADAVLYTSATAGSLDDASVSQTRITGLKVLADVGGAPADSACFAALELMITGA